MKAISLQHPYAAWVVEGRKPLETRMWSTSYRGPIFIHVSKSIDWAAMTRLGAPYHSAQLLNERGRVIGRAELVNCRLMKPEDEPLTLCPWEPRRKVFELQAIERIPSFPARGQLGLFEISYRRDLDTQMNFRTDGRTGGIKEPWGPR